MSKKNDFVFSPVEVAIYWGRLRAAADESADTLIRTAVAGIIRHMYDMACVFANRDRQAVVMGSPGATGLRGAMSNTLNFMLDAIPPNQLEPGDVVLTNDPYGCTGHLLDISLLLPIFSREVLVGYAIIAAHHADIGGVTDGSALDIYEEGLWIPPVKYHRAGLVDKTVQQFIARNVRVPDQVIPDIRAQIAAASSIARRVRTMAEELGEERFVALTHEILDRTEAATRAKLAELPDGSHTAELVTDRWTDRMGNETERLRIRVTITFRHGQVEMDYAGTSPQVPVGINTPFKSMTTAYSLTAVKSLIDPELPMNDGFSRCFKITAPEGCLVNPRPPAPTLSRSQVSFLLPEVVYRALTSALPQRVVGACGGTPSFTIRFVGRHGGYNFAETFGARGGFGGGYERDGVSCITYPGNVRGLWIETLEEQVPLICEWKEFRVDSAGQGQWRGGWGEEVYFRALKEGSRAPEEPITVNLRGGGRREWKVEGILGGLAGARGEIILDGKPIRSGQSISLFPGSSLVFRTEGGGGYGSPEKRSPELIRRDIEIGLLRPETARAVYGPVVDEMLTARQHE